MAQTEDEKAQASLFDELEKNDVTVGKDAAEQMKENILNDKGGGSYLGLGIHDVVVTSVELSKANSGTLGIKFNVENEDGKSDATMWLSEAALPYTIENVSRLLVHNANDDKKEEARNHMSNVVSAKELYQIVQTTLEARAKNKAPFRAFLSIREDQTGRTYTDKNGETKPSLVRNLLSYRPKETTTQAAAKEMGGGTPVDTSQLPF